jgi:multicomponent K+:H+ antiporter subunit E
MKKRLIPQPMMSVVLLIVWLLAHNAVSPGLLLLGVVFAIGIPLATAPYWPDYPERVNHFAVLGLISVVLFDIIVANVRVARLILGRRSRLHPTFFTVPVELPPGFPVTLLASIISLTPGTVSTELSSDQKSLLVHGLDVRDVNDTIARIKSRYERPLKRVFS